MSVGVGQRGAGVDRAVQAVVAVTALLTALGMVWLVQAGIGDEPTYRTVRVDNQASLPLQVDAVDGAGRLGMGEAGPRATASFDEVVDLGGTWTFVVTYGGREVSRQTITGQELAGRDWTIQIPATATAVLERQGYA
jgi:hypothetical protein